MEPDRYPRMIEIDDTLEAMQAVVGGNIEEYMPFEDEVAIVCHEEGKLIGLPPNRAIYAEPETVELTYSELADRFRNAESEGKKHLTGYIIFSQESFNKPYDEKSRTYAVSSDNKAFKYGFNEEQREYLAELLEDKNNSLWAAVLYGIHYSDDQIVTVALSQVGNVGGEPYWSWYGFGSRVEWCACFVSWCANECGYIETGVIPKFAGCVNGVQWFKDRGQWIDGSAEPVSGMIIFFDWDNKGSSGPQDGQSDHVGIVQKVENGIVYTVEGNSGDSCRVNQYSVGHYEVLGYGVPQY